MPQGLNSGTVLKEPEDSMQKSEEVNCPRGECLPSEEGKNIRFLSSLLSTAHSMWSLSEDAPSNLFSPFRLIVQWGSVW